jgi:ATP-binding cassette subfamily B protein
MMSALSGHPAVDEESGFSWRRVWALFAAHRRQVAALVGVVLVGAILGVANPLLIKVVFDDALFPSSGSPDVSLLVTLSVIMLLIAIVGAALGVYQTVLSNGLGQRVLRDLRDRVYRHLHSLSLSFYATARTGDLQSRISNDVGGVQTAVSSTLSSILSNSVTFIAAIIAMLILSWQLTLIALATLPLFWWATRFIGSRRRILTKQAQVATAEMNVLTQETLSVSGFTLARLFGQQQHVVDLFDVANDRLADVTKRQQVIGQAFFTIVQAFLGATPVLIYLAAGLLINGGTAITAGTIIAFTTLQNRLLFPVARLLETFVEFQSSQSMFERIFEYLDAKPDVIEPNDPVVLEPEVAEGELAFNGVHFAYPGTGEAPSKALDGIDFKASSGQLIAFVGTSGAGKSTILNLVPRLYDPTEGSITLDGVDLRQLSFGSIATLVGLVTQESYLFADTLRANIAYGRVMATDEEIEAACKAAAIHDRIVEFDDGYDTLVGERGFRLSGGEKQRIAIARVILHDPRVLVLDEATSALDSASERQIQAALAELVSGRTTLAVAHRLSTIQAADTIHVVEHGQIVESGAHDELLARGGAYRQLYHDQFADGKIETRCSDGFVMSDGQHQLDRATDVRSRATSLRKRRPRRPRHSSTPTR